MLAQEGELRKLSSPSEEQPFIKWRSSRSTIGIVLRWFDERGRETLPCLSCIHTKAVSVERLANQRLHLGLANQRLHLAQDEASDWLNARR
ncbi:hypothetical protein TNCV_3872361 [Trichonephila clavipes]|nr:hypothetical protein TNCV_3872361 [Trichonephila clavipes]